MKIKLQTYKAAIASLALGVAISLYGFSYTDGDDELTAEEIAALGVKDGLKDGDLYFDSEKEWSGDTLPDVADDFENAGLSPEKVAAFLPVPFKPYEVKIVTAIGALGYEVGDVAICVATNSDASEHKIRINGGEHWISSGWIRRVRN